MGIIASVAGIGGLFQANLALNYILGLRRNFKEFVLFDSVYLELKKMSNDLEIMSQSLDRDPKRILIEY